MPEPSAVAAVPRILVVHERYREAGGEDVVFDARRPALLERHGHAVERLVVDNDDIDSGDGIARADPAGDATPSGRGRAHGGSATAVGAFRPTVVHVHNTLPAPVAGDPFGGARRGAATVQTLHNYRLVCVSANLYRDGRPCNDCVGRRGGAAGRRPRLLPGLTSREHRRRRDADGPSSPADVVPRRRRDHRAHDIRPRPADRGRRAARAGSSCGRTSSTSTRRLTSDPGAGSSSSAA